MKLAWRNLIRNKVYSLINIGGLTAGLTITILIALWITDELSFDKYHQNYDRIVQVDYHSNVGGHLVTETSLPMPLGAELRNQLGDDFKFLASTLTNEQNLAYGEKLLTKQGCYAGPDFAKILTLDMVGGSRDLRENSILLNETLAKTIFGIQDPVNQVIKLNNSFQVRVTGVYRDLPMNSKFGDLNFIAPVHLLFTGGYNVDNWYSNSFQLYGQLNPGVSVEKLSSKIKNILYDHNRDATKPELFVFPMKYWHLYEFKDGNMVAGRLQFVWLFGIIGAFVLLLACINFMNLSTAQSEKRAKEVGIRKTIGSSRLQLIARFFSESYLAVIVSFLLALLVVQFSLPWFNGLSAKHMHIDWTNGLFWFSGFAFCFITGLIAGSYPALYLSSFKPVVVLKGAFKAGRGTNIPRKILIVAQFTVSITLIIGTVVVFRQIEFAKDRPLGYERDGLLSIPYQISGNQHFDVLRNELMKTNVVSGVSASSSPATGIWSSADNLNWKGKDPSRQELFGTILVDPDYAQVIGWQMKEGRNFSRQFLTDSSGFILNEAAVKQMGLKNPLGETVKWHGKDWTIIGVVKNMVMTSPFEPIVPTVFLIDDQQRSFNVINLKIHSNNVPIRDALVRIEAVMKSFSPGLPFNYRFADQEYSRKFAAEERIGKLAGVFTSLAILISCLGLFGMAAFVTEQRTKEIGIRKVIGASVLNLWGLLSKDFILLVLISCLLAVPVSYYFLHNWLQNYAYHTELPWWIFVASCVGALIITLLTVSYHSIKAALDNPIKSLRTE